MDNTVRKSEVEIVARRSVQTLDRRSSFFAFRVDDIEVATAHLVAKGARGHHSLVSWYSATTETLLARAFQLATRRHRSEALR